MAGVGGQNLQDRGKRGYMRQINIPVSNITSKDLSMAVAKTSASSLLEKFSPYTCLLSLH